MDSDAAFRLEGLESGEYVGARWLATFATLPLTGGLDGGC